VRFRYFPDLRKANQSALAKGFEESWLSSVGPAHLVKDTEIALAKPREAIELLRCDLGLKSTLDLYPGRGLAPIPESVFPLAIVQVAVEWRAVQQQAQWAVEASLWKLFGCGIRERAEYRACSHCHDVL
jgi:hypothetical protein